MTQPEFSFRPSKLTFGLLFRLYAHYVSMYDASNVAVSFIYDYYIELLVPFVYIIYICIGSGVVHQMV